MKNDEGHEKKNDGIIKVIFGEIRESVFLEVVGQIILFIPKMIIRIIRNY
ncbi:hypothetical protein [Paenisporosarcina indica]|nr:hypothetical protein [Paenisporosarcina indica]